MAKSRTDELVIKLPGKSVKLPLDSISYVESDGHQIIYHTDMGELALWGTLKEQEGRLPPDRFSRCSKYCIVNLKHITHFNGSSVTIGGRELPISRSQKKPFSDALMKYYGKYL